MNPFYGIEIVAVLFLSIILVNILTKWKKSSRALKAFAVSLLFIILSLITEIMDILEPQDDITILSLLPFIFGCFVSSAPWWYCTFLINDDADREIINPILAKISSVVMTLCIVAASVSYACGNLYIFSEPDSMGNVVKEYGPALLAIYAADLVSVIAMCVLLFAKRNQIKKSILILILLPVLLPLLGLIGESLIPGSTFSLPTGSIGLILQYLLIESHMVSDTEMREKLMNEMANTDVLTGLGNRRSYFGFLDEHPEAVDGGAMFFDVNNLKRTNDNLGHFEGDKLIARCASLLKENLPSSNLFRISGDEFVALYVSDSGRESFDCETITVRSVLKENNSIASMGTSWANNTNLTTTIRNAEEDMYRDKNEYYLSSGIERRR